MRCMGEFIGLTKCDVFALRPTSNIHIVRLLFPLVKESGWDGMDGIRQHPWNSSVPCLRRNLGSACKRKVGPRAEPGWGLDRAWACAMRLVHAERRFGIWQLACERLQAARCS